MQTYPPQNTKETAEFFRYGLIHGLHSVDSAMDWIDTVLIAETTPDITLIEASLCGSRGPLAVADWLSQVPGEFDRRVVARRLFGAMEMLLHQNPAKSQIVAHWLYLMAQDEYIPADEAESQMWSFDEDLSLAADGIHGCMEELNKDLDRFLAGYANVPAD